MDSPASRPAGPKAGPNDAPTNGPHRIPRRAHDDHTETMARTRRAFALDRAGVAMTHAGHYSLDPATLPGNIENFIGVAQVPIGLAGPLRVDGEHARGDFYVPLATTEGTLVASYSRGMRALSAMGGARSTVVADSMQRTPVFRFPDATRARDFGLWVDAHVDDIRARAESTTRSGRLTGIHRFQVGPLMYLRLNFTTGDAAGQNLTTKAAAEACRWIRDAHPEHPDYLLSGNADTDKKHSAANTLLTRGKRVVAEVTLTRDYLHDELRVDSRQVFAARQISNTGAFLTGAANNGAHAANGLAALFIATGQDVANVAESHAGIAYLQLLDNDDLYWSMTLPSLIVATHGGGTGLATQRECLDLLGCAGDGKVNKFAEICAAVVLAGEISLISAIIHGDWVTSHERLGRNR